MALKGKFRLTFANAKVVRPTSADDKAPKWNLLVPLGPHFRDDLPGGKMTVTPDMVQTMKANWERANKPRVRGDYFHLGGTDVPNVPLENKIASGWAVDLKCDDHGLWALIDWTDRARSYILADELASLSPEIFFNPVDRNNGGRQGPTLTAFGLLNDPSFDQLPHVAAAAPHSDDDEEQMNKKELCAKLGLAENATDAEIFAAIAAGNADKAALAELKAEHEKLKAAAKTSEDERVKLAAAGDTTVKALRDENVKLSARIDGLEKAKSEQAKTDFCAKLEREGRIIAADKERVSKLVDTMGLEEATKFAATWPVKVDVRELGHGDDGDMTKAAATKQFNDKVAELAAKEPALKTAQLYERIKAAHPALAKVAFSQN